MPQSAANSSLGDVGSAAFIETVASDRSMVQVGSRMRRCTFTFYLFPDVLLRDSPRRRWCGGDRVLVSAKTE